MNVEEITETIQYNAPGYSSYFFPLKYHNFFCSRVKNLFENKARMLFHFGYSSQKSHLLFVLFHFFLLLLFLYHYLRPDYVQKFVENYAYTCKFIWNFNRKMKKPCYSINLYFGGYPCFNKPGHLSLFCFNFIFCSTLVYFFFYYLSYFIHRYLMNELSLR